MTHLFLTIGRTLCSSRYPSARGFFGLISALALSPTLHAQTPPVAQQQLAELRAHRPQNVPEGSLISIEHLFEIADQIKTSHPSKVAMWQQRALQYLRRAREGHDPYPEQKGKITTRGYRSDCSIIPQGYTVYLPPNYDPAKSWPLYIALHGGSSNGNLFLGVVLGNNMPWERYNEHLWDEYEPRWSPNSIVVAPDGFGQVMWRWMGERDVLDVIADVQKHYNVDPNRIALGGLSNGGVGAYAIGTRHAWRFSAVHAMAGAPSWLQYAGGKPLPEETTAMTMLSGLRLAENTFNTQFYYFHGRLDKGPMKPSFVEEFTRELTRLALPTRVTWYDEGHDVLYLVHRHGRIYESLANVQRDPAPKEVRAITSDYRANRQHWLTISLIQNYPSLARAHGVFHENALRIETSNADALNIETLDLPRGTSSDIVITIDGNEVFRGARTSLARTAMFHRKGTQWQQGAPDSSQHPFTKRPGVSGPLTDAYYGRMIHVYGTQNGSHTNALRQAAERGSRGWPVWLWNFRQQVVEDRNVTPEMMRKAHLVLYGSPRDNSVLERIKDRLPIRIEDRAVTIGTQRYEGRNIGVRFIYPNPESPEQYVIVQAGTTLDAVNGGHRLPDFLPDYVVYDSSQLRTRPRLTLGKYKPLAIGYFDAHWQVREPTVTASREANSATEAPTPSLLPVPIAPPPPPRTRTFLAPRSDPAGLVAREIAQRVSSFTNYRSTIPGATWRTDEQARWSIRRERDCLQALRQTRIRFTPLPPMPTPVPTPIELQGTVEGIRFRSMHADRAIVISCELATRLVDMVNVLQQHKVASVDVISSYREEPRESFHTMGLALDVSRFRMQDGAWLTVETDFARTPDMETCASPSPPTESAQKLAAIACDLASTGKFSSVLTPNYNEGHHDHFHIDIRPDDPRIFIR